MTDLDDDDEEEDMSSGLPEKNLMTPMGFKMLHEEREQLTRFERPKIVEIVSWAAGNGDRSENGDYLYNKKRLREIDRRLRYLGKKLDNDIEIVDPAKQKNLKKVYFGATVTYARADDTELTVKLVGIDEADMAQGKINWLSPVGKALLQAAVGDMVKVRTDTGVELIEILKIVY